MPSATLFRFLVLSAVLIYSNAGADCLGAGFVRGNDPCNPRKAKQNIFNESNVGNSRMTPEDYANEKARMAQQQAINARQNQYLDGINNKRAAEAEAARQKQAQEQELALRRQEIAARNRQADASEAAAAAAASAAQSAAIAAQSAQNSAQNNSARAAPTQRSLRCNFSTGWCD